MEEYFSTDEESDIEESDIEESDIIASELPGVQVVHITCISS